MLHTIYTAMKRHVWSDNGASSISSICRGPFVQRVLYTAYPQKIEAMKFGPTAGLEMLWRHCRCVCARVVAEHRILNEASSFLRWSLVPRAYNTRQIRLSTTATVTTTIQQRRITTTTTTTTTTTPNLCNRPVTHARVMVDCYRPLQWSFSNKNYNSSDV